ncbi:MAG: TolC family protein [Gemmatimonadota bacterium]|nr:TolC family protein [Gemmatimonadota bacterium]
MSSILFFSSAAVRLSLVSAVCTVVLGAQVRTAAPTGSDATGRRVDRPSPALDSLLAVALEANPKITAAAAHAQAVRTRIAPAGARPDPILMAGLLNFPVSQPGFSDFMTMKMIGISQSLPYPGKLGLRTRAATDEARGAEALVAAARLQVTQTVEDAYYDLAFLDRAMEIVTRNQAMLGSLAKVTEVQYTAGGGAQADLLRVQTEAARLSSQASTLVEARHATLARLNAALDRPSDIPVPDPSIPDRVAHAAVPDSAAEVHFTSAALGARVVDSPLLPLDSIQALAVRLNPMLQAHEAEIQAQAARAELANKARLPDFDVSLQYGQRRGRGDMVSAVISIPIPLQGGRNQDAESAAAHADLNALEAGHRSSVDSLRAEIASSVSDIERSRTQLALSMSAIIPQARATLASATAGYQVGRVAFSSMIDAQASLFTIETAYWLSLTDFAKSLATLRRTVGAEVLR